MVGVPNLQISTPSVVTLWVKWTPIPDAISNSYAEVNPAANWFAKKAGKPLRKLYLMTIHSRRHTCFHPKMPCRLNFERRVGHL